ncbi:MULTISPECIES: hypothetical protein [unclassified Thermotoga]|uniref:hypothetical protein n=1 Tax=unclassified Thermotoga TaxID=2631113 RepID=UPI000280E91E|nr:MULTISPECIES: hypothetical protein [unclassified Thermotoga]AIY85687.1 hypothetical protein T2812B_00680 [Thermotoga sp. 2812B]EJX26503.1 hypothetical protein EMP_02119 [Thermotoga sp. EMP]
MSASSQSPKGDGAPQTISMRKLSVLLRYAPARGRKGFYSVLISVLMTGFLFYSLMGNNFKAILEEFGEEAFSALLSFSTTMFSVMFLLGVSFYLSNSFVLEGEIEFLLTLPIERSTIVIYQLLISLFYQSFILIMMILNFFMYSLLMNNWMPFVTGVFHTVFLLLGGAILSVLFGRLLRTSLSRKLYSLIQLLAVFLFLILVNLPDFSVSFGRWFISNWNVFAYAVFSRENPIFLLYEILICLGTFLVFRVISTTVMFEPVLRKERMPVEKPTRFPGKGFFKKDLITLLREERSLYLLLYPIGFGVLMTFVGSPDFGLIFAIGIAALYNATMSAMLWRKEMEVWPLPKVLPVKTSEVMISKILVSSLLNSAVVSAFVIFLAIYQKQVFYIFFAPAGLSLFLFISALGLLLSKWEKTGSLTNPAKVFSGPEILLLQLVAIGVVGVLGYALSTGSHLMFFSILLATVVGSVFGFIWAFKRIVFRAERLEE